MIFSVNQVKFFFVLICILAVTTMTCCNPQLSEWNSDMTFYSCLQLQTALHGPNQTSPAHPAASELFEMGQYERQSMDHSMELPMEFGKTEVTNNDSVIWKPDSEKSDSVMSTFLMHYLSRKKSALKEKIRYLLFTNNNTREYQVMAEDGSVEGTNWNPNGTTKLLIHGLTSTYWLPAITNIWTQHIFDIKDAYFSEANRNKIFNVIVVDWTSLSTVTLSRYSDAAKATQLAGEDVAAFPYGLEQSGNIFVWKDVHLLGHSLGAHVAGVAGNKLKQFDLRYTIERITGLDPAGLCFDTPSGVPDNLSHILDRTDANFVDIIHTNMGNLVMTAGGRFGSLMETGHADFYPNGGEVQQGCSFMEDRLRYCSHQKSVIFYTLSILNRNVACPCGNWEMYSSSLCNCNITNGGYYFGEHCDTSARGRFFLPGLKMY